MKLEQYLETEKLKEDIMVAHRNVTLQRDEMKGISLVFLHEGEVVNRLELKEKEGEGLPYRMKLRIDGETKEVDQDFEDMTGIYDYFRDHGRDFDASKEIIAIIFFKGKE